MAVDPDRDKADRVPAKAEPSIRRPGFRAGWARFVARWRAIFRPLDSVLARYALPFLAIFAVFVLHGAMVRLIPARVDFPYALLYLVAMFSVAWFGGYIPGAITCVIIMVGLPMAVNHAFRLANVDPLRLGLLLLLSLLISNLARGQRQRRELLRRANEDLESRVESRTRDLAQAVEALEAEIGQRRQTEQKLKTQLERLHLLDQITRAIAERLDLNSVFQVVVRSLEKDLPLDFACICLQDPMMETMVVACVGSASRESAGEFGVTEQAHIPVIENGLSRCVSGQLVYERDAGRVDAPFCQRLARGGLRGVVAAPLPIEDRVFGVLIAARRQPDSFSSGECEFLRQLGGHVALAANQAQVYAALKQAYEDLRLTQQKAMQQERLRALGQMASGIAHDMNNALSPAAVYSELLSESEHNLSDRSRRYLNNIRRAIGDVVKTVGRLREFYRQPETAAQLSSVDLKGLIHQVKDLTRAKWSDMLQHGGAVIQWETEIAPDLPSIAGDESEIREALTNLVFNAVDAMPSGGTLSVRARAVPGAAEARHVEVEISDTGAGMDEETRRRCLEPFFTTKGERGTGLGLAMVYGIAKRHNAEIEIDSAPGKGTTARLRFPVQVAAAAPPETIAVDSLPAHLRILSVDDDPLLIKSLREALENDGHVVVSAHGGQEGIDIFRESRKQNEPFSVVITDLGMPHVDGRKVASAVKSSSPATPVILLTGWGEGLSEAGPPSNVDRVLNKPPKLRDLRNALAELTRQQA